MSVRACYYHYYKYGCFFEATRIPFLHIEKPASEAPALLHFIRDRVFTVLT